MCRFPTRGRTAAAAAGHRRLLRAEGVGRDGRCRLPQDHSRFVALAPRGNI